MREYLLTGHLAPAAILYNSTLAIQAIGWILISTASIKTKLKAAVGLSEGDMKKNQTKNLEKYLALATQKQNE